MPQSEKDNIQMKLDHAMKLVRNEIELCEELMSLTNENQMLSERFRYIRDDEQKHEGLLKMLRQMTENIS